MPKLFATLDTEANNDQNGEQKPLTANDILDAIRENPQVQKDMSRLDESQVVNMQLAQEVLAFLREVENPLYDSIDGDKYINWETEPIPYQILRRAGESEPARLIKNKRRLDFMQFGKSPQYEGERGAQLVFRNSDYQPTKEEKLLLKEWEGKIFDNLFFPANDPYPNFGKFLGNAYEDFFDLDDITLEYRMDGFGRPIAIHLQDPIIYKPVIKERVFSYNELYKDDISDLINDYEKLFDIEEIKDIQKVAEKPDYLLVKDNHKLAGVTRERVRKFHFFTRSDYRKAQRGYSIIEQGVRLVTHIVNAITMNASNFTNNRMPPGFFAFTGGGVNQMLLERLKKIFYAYQSGANNANRFPMISMTGEKSDVKWVGVRGNSKDVEYHQFMTLLFSIFCQLSGTDPKEVSMGSYADAVGKRGLFDESNDGVIKESRDAGARTFLSHLADSANTPNKHGVNIFQNITKMDVKLKFVGFEVEDKKAKSELMVKDLQSAKSINDLLAERDEEKQTLMLGDTNIYDVKGFQNPQVYQSVLFNAQQKMQKEAQLQQGQQNGQMPGQEQGQPQGQEEPGQTDGQNAGQEEQTLTPEDEELRNRFSPKQKTQLDNILQQELSEQE